MFKILLNSSIFCDVGAFKGVYSEFASKYLKEGGKIYIFEPRIRSKHLNYYKIVESAKLRKINCKIYEKALSDKIGTSLIIKDTLCKRIEYKNKRRPENVETSTLDATMIAENNLIPDIVKIDVEGWEYNVLLGSKKIIEACKTHFFLELHWGYLANEGNVSGHDVLKLFNQEKYNIDLLSFKNGKPFDRVKGEKRYAKTALSHYHIYPKHQSVE